MSVRRYLGNRERVGLLTAALTQGMPAADMDGRASAQVGQPEIHPSIAAIGGAQQRKERLILVDRQELPISQRPAFRCKNEGEEPDLT